MISRKPNLREVIIAAGFIAALAIGIVMYLFGGYTMKVDGRVVGSAQTTKTFSTAMNARTESVRQDTGLEDANTSSDVEIVRTCRFDDSWTNDIELASNTLNTPVSYTVAGVVVTADDNPIAYFESEDVADKALTKVILATADVTNHDDVLSCSFENNLSVKKESFDISKINGEDDLAVAIAGQDKVNQINQSYTDLTDETAQKLTQTVSSIPKEDTASTDTSESTEDTGSNEQQSVTINSLGTTTVKESVTTVVVPHNQTVNQDPNQYVGYEKIEQAGQDGISVKTDLQVYKDNQLVQSTTMSDVVTQQAVDEIKTVGTKEVKTMVSKDGKIIIPCNGLVTSYARGTGAHGNGTAVDIANSTGSPIFAAADGEVILAESYGGYGNCIIIESTDGTQQYLTGHLATIGVKVGDQVKQGDVIGGMGSTGHSTGTHCHFEVRDGNGERQLLSNYFDLSTGMTI